MSDDAEFIRKLKNQCGVPRHFAKMELEEMDDGGSRDYRRQLKRFADLAADVLDTGEFIERPIFVYLSGNFGAGKTRVATWLVKRAFAGLLKHRRGRISPTRSPLFIRATKLVEYRFSKRGDEEGAEEWEVMRERIFASRFLVVDDIGRIASYKGEVEFLERVIEDRHDEERSTVITSNLADADLPSRFADFISMFEEVTLKSDTRRERGSK